MEPSTNIQTMTIVADDGSFIRTGLLMSDHGEGDGFSVDLLDSNGVRVARLNGFFYQPDGNVIFDIIDVDNRFKKHTTFIFNNGRRQWLEGGNLISADFRERNETDNAGND